MTYPIELKPYMRVVTRNKGVWLVLPNDKSLNLYSHADLILYKPGCGWNTICFEEYFRDTYQDYMIIKVNDKPFDIRDLLDPDKSGDRLWDREEDRKIQQKKVRIAELEAELEQLKKEVL
jgi:hypothetical protein